MEKKDKPLGQITVTDGVVIWYGGGSSGVNVATVSDSLSEYYYSPIAIMWRNWLVSLSVADKVDVVGVYEQIGGHDAIDCSQVIVRR